VLPVSDGLVVVVKADCPTCVMVGPVIEHLRLPVISEDDDAGLELSYHLAIETVPTVLRVEDGREVARIVGWQRAEW